MFKGIFFPYNENQWSLLSLDPSFNKKSIYKIFENARPFVTSHMIDLQ